MFLKNTLILRPQILIQLIQRLVYQDEIESDIEDGLIDERMFEQLCQPFIEQKQSLLALFKRFDLLCERLNPSTNSTNCKQYYVPGRIRRAQTEKSIHDKEEPSVTFYYVFDGYFPGQSEKRQIRFGRNVSVFLQKVFSTKFLFEQ